MSSKVGYLRRYLLIIQQVKKRKFINMDELIDIVQNQMAYYDDSDSIGVSKSTIRRDLKDIRDNFFVEIKYSKTNNGYYIPDDDNVISDFETLCEQLDLLGAT
jgi:DeoR/GlpR family transcriptional regulator of sugar metabolism